MAEQPTYELRVLEDDQTVPPRPEEEVADLRRDASEPGTDRDAS